MQKDIASLLKQFRLERDWTLQRMGEFAGISFTAIRSIELREVKPNARTIYKLRKAIPEIHLFLEEQEKEEQTHER